MKLMIRTSLICLLLAAFLILPANAMVISEARVNTTLLVSDLPPGATVEFILNGGVPVFAIADASGTARFLPLLEGTLEIIAIQNGVIIDQETVTVLPEVIAPVAGSISGFMINDTNGNGQPDPGETGLPDRKIMLVGIIGTGIDSKFIGKETSTDDQGFYIFDNLPAGRYILAPRFQRGFVPTSPSIRIVMLTAGQNSVDNNFMTKPVLRL